MGAKPFQPGNPGGPGRKPGELQRYRQLDYWGKRLENDVDKLDATERVKSYLKMMELILTYKALAPNTTREILAEVESIFEKQREKMREPQPPAGANETNGSI